MPKTLIGTVSYGGLDFLKLLIRGIRETLTEPADIVVVAALPGDYAMREYVSDQRLNLIAHDDNKGFPASLNDLYDFAFKDGDYDNLIICGNDTIPIHGCLDAMIRTANSTEWEMICGSEFNSKFLVIQYPEALRYFEGDNLVFRDFFARPWELHKDFREGVEPDTLKDVRNMTLVKRSVFEKVGYADVNFWPNGYFEDNDYALRCHRNGVKACGLKEAAFFHFWSRTIHQNANRNHVGYFQKNEQFYVTKYGGRPNNEKFDPFNDSPYRLTNEVTLLPVTNITERGDEAAIIKHWASL